MMDDWFHGIGSLAFLRIMDQLVFPDLGFFMDRIRFFEDLDQVFRFGFGSGFFGSGSFGFSSGYRYVVVSYVKMHHPQPGSKSIRQTISFIRRKEGSSDEIISLIAPTS